MGIRQVVCLINIFRKFIKVEIMFLGHTSAGLCATNNIIIVHLYYEMQLEI